MEEGQKGISFYTTRDGVRCMRLHYSADPDKDPDTEQGSRWIGKQLRGYPGGMSGPKWQREMEINWQTLATNKVFPNWSEMQQHVVVPPWDDIPEHWPIYIGYDHGVNNPSVWMAIAFEAEDMVHVFDETVMESTEKDPMTAPRQAAILKQKPYYDRIRGIVGDNSIWRRDQTEGRNLTSVGEIFEDNGIFIDKANKYEGIDAAFITLLTGVMWRDIESPKLTIASNCTKLLRELRNLHWKEWKTADARNENAAAEKISSKFVDAFDALKYIMLAMWRGDDAEALLLQPGTVEWILRDIEQQADRRRYILS